MGLTTVIAIGAVIYSHDSQVRDRQVMKAGVERDRERLREKRRQQKLLQEPQEPQEQQLEK
jgi:hypothetical protein